MITLILLQRAFCATAGIQNEMTLSVQGSNGMVQKLIVETSELDLSNAVRQTSEVVADFIDTVSFGKRVPILIRHIEVHILEKKFLRRYITFSYAPRQLTENDFRKFLAVPPRLKAALRLFREGFSSNKPHYQLLCLYRVWELIQKVRTENNKDILGRGMKPDRPKRLLPANDLTNCYFSTFVGKSTNNFLDHTYSESRNDLAHGNWDTYSKLVLDPGNVHIAHRIDATNAVLMSVLTEMIQDEMDLMARHGLEGGILLAGDNAESA